MNGVLQVGIEEERVAEDQARVAGEGLRAAVAAGAQLPLDRAEVHRVRDDPRVVEHPALPPVEGLLERPGLAAPPHLAHRAQARLVPVRLAVLELDLQRFRLVRTTVAK